MATKVINIKLHPDLVSGVDYIYIGRAGHGEKGLFGNPVKVGQACCVCGKTHSTKGSTLTCFEIYFKRRLLNDLEFAEAVRNLKGRTLGCFCKPQQCHGDIIRKYLDQQAESLFDAV